VLRLARQLEQFRLFEHVRTGGARLESGVHLSTLIKNTIGVIVTTVVQDPATVECSMGKMRRISTSAPA
jgi:hypothetical protein